MRQLLEGDSQRAFADPYSVHTGQHQASGLPHRHAQPARNILCGQHRRHRCLTIHC